MWIAHQYKLNRPVLNIEVGIITEYPRVRGFEGHHA